jgi:hypothetical protein
MNPNSGDATNDKSVQSVKTAEPNYSEKSDKWFASRAIQTGTVVETEISVLFLRTDPEGDAPIIKFVELIFERKMTELNPLIRPLINPPPEPGRLKAWSTLAQRWKRTELECVQYEDALQRHTMEMSTPATRTHLGHAVFPRFSKHLSHSCRPNCTLLYDVSSSSKERDGVQRARCILFSIRPICANDPLTITLCDDVPSFPFSVRQTILIQAGLVDPKDGCVCSLCDMERKFTHETKSSTTNPNPNRKTRRASARAGGNEKTEKAEKKEGKKKESKPVDVLEPYREMFAMPIHQLFGQLVRGCETMDLYTFQHGLFIILLPRFLLYGFERFSYGLYRTEYGVKEFDKLQPETARSTLQSYCDRLCAILMVTRRRLYVSGHLSTERCMIFHLTWLMITLECKRLKLHDNVFGPVSVLPSLLSQSFQKEWIRLVRQSEPPEAFCMTLFESLSETWQKDKGTTTLSNAAKEKISNDSSAKSVPIRVQTSTPMQENSESKTAPATATTESKSGTVTAITESKSGPATATTESKSGPVTTAPASSAFQQKNPESKTTPPLTTPTTAVSPFINNNLIIYDKIQELMLYDPQMAAELGKTFYELQQKQLRPIGPKVMEKSGVVVESGTSK